MEKGCCNESQRRWSFSSAEPAVAMASPVAPGCDERTTRQERWRWNRCALVGREALMMSVVSFSTETATGLLFLPRPHRRKRDGGGFVAGHTRTRWRQMVVVELGCESEVQTTNRRNQIHGGARWSRGRKLGQARVAAC